MRTPILALVLSSVSFCYEGPWQPVVYDYYHIDLSELGGHPHFEVPHHHGGKTPIPRDAIVDVINELGIKLLAIHNERNENNIAISPYGAFSVLAALTEGLQGDAAHEILHAAHIPKDKHVLRVGLRDIHRHLKSYFIPEEGFLAGLTLNLNNVTLKSEYEDVLHFYGFDYASFNNALYPEPPTTKKPAESTTLETGLTISEEETTVTITEKTKEISTRVGGSSSERTIEDITTTTEFPITSVSSSLPTTTGETTTTQPQAATTTELFPTLKSITTTNEPSETTTEKSPATRTFTATTTTTIPSTAATETTTKISETTILITTPIETTTRISETTIETTTKIPETTTLITTPIETTTKISETTTPIETATKIPETTTLITTPIETTTKTPETTTIITTTETTKPPETTTIMTTPQDTETTTTTKLPPTTTETTTSPIRTTREVTTISMMPELTTEAPATDDQLLETTTPFFFGTTPEFQETPQNANYDFNYNNYDANNVPPVYDENNNVPETLDNFKRQTRSVVDYVIARFHDGNHHYDAVPPPRPQYIPQEPLTFAVYGKFRESGINFMKYDTVLPYFYVQNLNAMALSFPLDSSKYYLLLLLPVGDNGVDQLICDLRLHGNLRYIIDNLKLTHVVATIPSFMLKGYVTLTPALQRLGIRKIFEPRQADFSPMTNETDIYVTNIEQAVTVTIRNYLDPSSQRYKNFQQYPPVYFKADHPFLYFVIDSELHVALMVGKVINPLNSRIR
ncbi:unnamed protein product [Ceutorhynchus assimilis]|uniref:Serpin domain-containing protein n=1 Tax=Ceutorhynchus assimilis TaxID=467358 RepID=A0A9N9MRW5_9CUCU|nr:unnamed protein product [Ceutorhynchus assimilis]